MSGVYCTKIYPFAHYENLAEVLKLRYRTQCTALKGSNWQMVNRRSASQRNYYVIKLIPTTIMATEVGGMWKAKFIEFRKTYLRKGEDEYKTTKIYV